MKFCSTQDDKHRPESVGGLSDRSSTLN